MWLSLVEHLVRDQGVAGSNPVIPTMKSRGYRFGPVALFSFCAHFVPIFFAFLQFYKAGHVSVPAMLLLIVGFLAGSYLSAGHAVALPDILLKRLFGGLLIVMGAIYILTAR